MFASNDIPAPYSVVVLAAELRTIGEMRPSCSSLPSSQASLHLVALAAEATGLGQATGRRHS